MLFCYVAPDLFIEPLETIKKTKAFLLLYMVQESQDASCYLFFANIRNLIQ
ncbi:hypothetical protein XNW1_2390006 [Xenorhabdus nematophila str. Websteri]|nr:hypothetical protein XNW1_2390006 [Xenorhabdus nematophila str. Websteri]